MVIDGLGNRRITVIFFRLYLSLEHRKKWKNLIPSDCRLLLGTKFILLRRIYK